MEKRSNETKLFEVASLQQGFFTTRQAKEAGYSESRFAYHIKTGKWSREGRSIYRLVQYPQGERPDLVYWSLWTCNKKGDIQGVFSHLTALAIHDLSDVMPDKYYISVHKKFRKYHQIPNKVVLYYENINTEDYYLYDGYRVTTPLKTILDVLDDTSISNEITEQAIREGLSRGLITKKELINGVSNESKDRLNQIFKQIGVK